ncbi:MAG: HNH endonuclease signature motif containing protein [Gemmatimonadetes bacterium]|nr:HNH endonuclease signature motif containing protein [Gemmatimonadota bacterium]
MGRPWRRIRARKLQRDPLCQPCLKNGRTTSATEVHHVTPRSLGGDHSPANLMSICTPCHNELGMPRRVRSDGIAVLEDGTILEAV